jgi:hypothetical protein
MNNQFCAYLGILFLIFISCSSSTVRKATDTTCNENLAFKKIFFENIKNVEVCMAKTFDNIEDVEEFWTDERSTSFDKSLRFISNYSKVSFESMANYDGSYPSGVYEKDKANWLKWYDVNKCRNIQIRDSI